MTGNVLTTPLMWESKILRYAINYFYQQREIISVNILVFQQNEIFIPSEAAVLNPRGLSAQQLTYSF